MSIIYCIYIQILIYCYFIEFIFSVFCFFWQLIFLHILLLLKIKKKIPKRVTFNTTLLKCFNAFISINFFPNCLMNNVKKERENRKGNKSNFIKNSIIFLNPWALTSWCCCYCNHCCKFHRQSYNWENYQWSLQQLLQSEGISQKFVGKVLLSTEVLNGF